MEARVARDLFWVGSCQKDFGAFPEKVRANVMAALYLALDGQKATNVKPLQGFSGASVLEIVERGTSGTYRCIYTVKLQTAIYILHAFQKKSHQGISTPQEHIDMIKRRLKWASEIDAEIIKREKKGK
jgi:phage-related protein